MEERKQKEIEYYDKRAKMRISSEDFRDFDPLLLGSFRYCYDWLEKNSKGRMVLDYGCGKGFHSIFPARNGAIVVGIDLSEKALEIAGERAQKNGLEEKIRFLKMDCEKTEFKDNSFDIIFDGGTFSSLDLSKALPELARILKPDGFLLGIETFGHNPITNLKRGLNRIVGKRTSWAASHIFRDEDFEKVKNYFNNVEAYYFHPISWIVFPFLKLASMKPVLGIFEKIDKIILRLPFLRKYSFKVVFILSLPKKQND